MVPSMNTMCPGPKWARSGPDQGLTIRGEDQIVDRNLARRRGQVLSDLAPIFGGEHPQLRTKRGDEPVPIGLKAALWTQLGAMSCDTVGVAMISPVDVSHTTTPACC